MRRLFAGLMAFALSVAGSHLVLGQQAPAGGGQRGAGAPGGGGGGGAQRGAPQPMGFFITSVGLGKGANLGGLAGAVVDQIARAAAGSEEIVLAFAEHQVVAALAEEPIAAGATFVAARAEVAVESVHGRVIADAVGAVAVQYIVVGAAEDQVGAGIARAPLACFEQAVIALARSIDRSADGEPS